MCKNEVALSVIIPCFNDGRYLPEAVASAKPHWQGRHEIIVVNDGSTEPDTLIVLQSLRDEGDVRVIDQVNRGLGAARNRGIATSRGRYILPLDADNRIRAEYIDCGIEMLNREAAVDVVYGDAEYFGERTGRWSVPDFNLRRLLADNYIDACAVFRRSAWERCGGYDEHMPMQGREDWDLWVRIAMTGGRFHHVAQPLFDYRVRADSMTGRMTKPTGHQDTLRRYIQARRVEMTIGEYAQPQHSLDFVLELVRQRPVHTLLALLVRAFLPCLLPALPTPRQPNDRQVSSPPTTDAPS